VADDDKIEFIEIEGANGYVTEDLSYLSAEAHHNLVCPHCQTPLFVLVSGSVALVADQDD